VKFTNFLKSNLLIMSGFGFAGMFWLFESLLHTYIYRHGTLASNLAPSDPDELTMRAMIIVLFLVFSGFSQIIMNRQRRLDSRMRATLLEIDQIFQTAAGGMRVVDTNYNVLRANRTFTEMARVSMNETIGKKCYEIFGGPKCHTPDCRLRRIMDGREQVVDETVKQRSDGSQISCIVTATPFRGPDGSLRGIVEDFRDVSELKNAEAEKRKLEIQVIQMQKMEAIGALAGGIAHDFNNILTAILGYSDLARKDLGPGSPVLRRIDEIVRASQRARDLVRQILTFSRKTSHDRQPVDIDPIVEEALKLIEVSIPKNITIERHIGTGMKQVLADPTQIHQVVMNLCTNAAHAMPEGGLLEVRLGFRQIEGDDPGCSPELSPGPYVELMVRDTGYGMSPDIVDKVFDPFFTTKPPGDGTGMGLAVVHGIVKSHGGAISVSSTPGRGTSFFVHLPVVSQMDIIEDEASGTDPGKLRILLVDDEESLVRLWREVLESMGFNVETRTSAMEAHELFASEPDRFDLIVTDYAMPGMTGLELSQSVLRIRPDIPIILCTGFSHMMGESFARKMGVREFVLKPIVRQDMARIIRKTLNEHSDRDLTAGTEEQDAGPG